LIYKRIVSIPNLEKICGLLKDFIVQKPNMNQSEIITKIKEIAENKFSQRRLPNHLGDSAEKKFKRT